MPLVPFEDRPALTGRRSPSHNHLTRFFRPSAAEPGVPKTEVTWLLAQPNFKTMPRWAGWDWKNW